MDYRLRLPEGKTRRIVIGDATRAAWTALANDRTAWRYSSAALAGVHEAIAARLADHGLAPRYASDPGELLVPADPLAGDGGLAEELTGLVLGRLDGLVAGPDARWRLIDSIHGELRLALGRFAGGAVPPFELDPPPAPASRLPPVAEA